MEEMEVVFDYDETTGTWSEAPKVYGTIECATKEDYEYAKKAIKGYKELEAKHWDECRQIAHYDNELKKAKRLLKLAVEDIHELLCDKKNLDGNGQSCNICSYIEWCPCCKECTIREDLRNWRYADEALKLIGDEPNGI